MARSKSAMAKATTANLTTAEERDIEKKSGTKKSKKPTINVPEKLAESESAVAEVKKGVVKEEERAPDTVSPYRLDKEQSLKAARALLKHLSATAVAPTKPNLLEDASNPSDRAIQLWLVLTTKKYITDSKKLKPFPIRLPNSLHQTSPTPTVCLIVKDPQRHFKDLVDTAGLAQTVTKVVGLNKLRAKFKTFESRRQLMDSHDLFLADDRIITMLPATLGSSFYRKTSKIPLPISLTSSGTPENLKNQIHRALRSTFVHLSPAATTSIRIALSSFTPEQVVENIEQVVSEMTAKKIPGGWRNVRSLLIKSPTSASLPLYMAGEMYGDEDVMKPEEEQERLAFAAKQSVERKERKEKKNAKRKGLSGSEPAKDDKPEKDEGEEKPKKKKAKVAAEEIK